MNEFHVVSTGISLLSNAQKAGILPSLERLNDQDFWNSFLNDSRNMEALYQFLQEDPMKHSAELNTFYRATENKNPSQIEVYLVGTKTAPNELVRRLLERNLKERKYRIFTPYEISGYFWEAQHFDPSYGRDEFVKGIGELLDRLIYLGKKKRQEGYRVFFNPTGGLKAHVITCALAGFLTGSEVYYMNEEFPSLIVFPNLFYIPKGKEIEVLRALAEVPRIPRPDADSFFQNYKDEIDRLSLYQLIELDPLRIRNTGRLILESTLIGPQE